jgi:diaminopimelate decarboxylase
VPTSHPSGWAHADGALRGPSWLQPPADPDSLVPHLWSRTARKNDRGELVIGGVVLADLVADVNTPTYVLDEADFRARARAFRDGFAGYDVYYAGKAFLCTTVARWVAEEGLRLARSAATRSSASRRSRPGKASPCWNAR